MFEDTEGEYCPKTDHYHIITNGVSYSIWWDCEYAQWDSSMAYKDESKKVIYDRIAKSF